MKNATHMIVMDDDGHHYVIPRDKEAEFESHMDATYKFWRELPEDEDPPTDPEWMDLIGGSPDLVTFHAEGYTIEGRDAS